MHNEINFSDLPEYEDMDLDNGSVEPTIEEVAHFVGAISCKAMKNTIDNAHYLTEQEKSQLLDELKETFSNLHSMVEEEEVSFDELPDTDVEDLDFPDSTISPHYADDFADEYPELDFDEDDIDPFTGRAYELTPCDLIEEYADGDCCDYRLFDNVVKPKSKILADKRTIAMLLMKAHRFEQINEMTRLGFSKSSVEVWVETGNVNNLQLEMEAVY